MTLMTQQEIAAEMLYRREEYLANLGIFKAAATPEQLNAAEASAKEWLSRYLKSITETN